MSNDNLYEKLEVSPDASRQQIISAAKAKNQQLKDILAVLAHAEKRAAYDQQLAEEEKARQTASKHPSMLTKIRFLAVCEGMSLLLLLGIAMPLKYFADYSMAVFVIGSLHGILFVLYLVYLITGKFTVPLPIGTTLLGILASIIPFAPFFVDQRLKNYA